ncbi:YdcF family protein [Cardiobacteriaceae bacterium TAE3-ERU3]|nr:YdcF family protein [Cardiobacteriaceae bacterium TAE3-ERU3]
MKRLMILLVLALLALIIIPISAYLWIELQSRDYLYDQTADIPERDVAIVLGTAKYLAGGRTNLFYTSRIKAAAELYHAGKVRYIIVSGANPSRSYNEPAQMKADLIAAGIPAERIQPDYAGLRTLDSILRAEHIFGQTRYTIVSQPFHNARAVYIARHQGHDVVAYNAGDVSLKSSIKTRIREFGARLKALLDLHITDKEAKYYGDPIPFPPHSTQDTP